MCIISAIILEWPFHFFVSVSITIVVPNLKNFNTSIKVDNRIKITSAKRRHISEAQIKIHCMAYLYNRGEYGANAYTIMQKANIPSQDFNRFREFLEDLCRKSYLRKIEEETGGDKITN